MKILVVDPDRVSRRLAALLVERRGYPSPALAEDVAALPVGDWSFVLAGLAARDLPALRDALGASARIVLMTAQDSDEVRRACTQAGIDQVLGKPLAMDALAAAIAPAVSGDGDFNAATWAELRQLFGATGLVRLCNTLLDDLPLQRAALASADRDRDAAAIKRIAHSLRGVSLQLGAAALANEWTRAEQHAKAGEVETALPLATELMARHAALAERVRDEIRRS